MISVVSPATYSEPTGRSADLQSAVSQNCILHSVERGPGRRASPCSGPCRLQIGDTADCKSALRHRICVTAHLAPQIENRTSVLTTNTSGSVQVRTLLYVGHWAGLLSGLSGHQFARESIRLARNCRRRSAQGTEAQAAARELRVEAEQSRVALRCDLHLAGGAGRVAGRDREEPAPGDQTQDMSYARGPGGDQPKLITRPRRPLDARGSRGEGNNVYLDFGHEQTIAIPGLSQLPPVHLTLSEYCILEKNDEAHGGGRRDLGMNTALFAPQQFNASFYSCNCAGPGTHSVRCN